MPRNVWRAPWRRARYPTSESVPHSQLARQSVPADISLNQESLANRKAGHLAVIGAATRTLKQQNEDTIAVHKGPRVCAIALADGLGSSVDGHLAASLASGAFIEAVKAREIAGQPFDFEAIREIWRSAADRIVAHFQEHRAQYEGARAPLQTTLIALISTKDLYYLSYLGNGSAWLVRGDFLQFKTRRWPWCLSDLMVGHTALDHKGRDVLYGILGPAGPTTEIAIHAVNMDPLKGEMFILTSDGISSSDHLRLGPDKSGKLWIEVNPLIEKLLMSYLAPPKTPDSQTRSLADDTLTDILQRFLAESTLDDDATVGVFISPLALSSLERGAVSVSEPQTGNLQKTT